MNMAAFAVACEIACSIPPLKAPPFWSGRRSGIEGERKHQEEVADLRQRRVGDQQLQSFLAQRDDAAEQDRRRAQHRQ